MIQLRSLSKSVVCAMMVVGLAPATSGAQPQLPPSEGGGLTESQKGVARNPRVIIVASDNCTPLFYVECSFGQNAGECLDTTFNFNGETFAGLDTNRLHTFIGGRARVGSTLGALATQYTTYSYDDLYIETDVRLRAVE